MSGYVYWDADHYDDLVMPEQGYAELFQLAYQSSLIRSADHPIIKRGALRKSSKT